MPKENNPELGSRHQVSDEVFVRVKEPEPRLNVPTVKCQRIALRFECSNCQMSKDSLELASRHQVSDAVFQRERTQILVECPKDNYKPSVSIHRFLYV